MSMIVVISIKTARISIVLEFTIICCVILYYLTTYIDITARIDKINAVPKRLGIRNNLSFAKDISTITIKNAKNPDQAKTQPAKKPNHHRKSNRAKKEEDTNLIT